MKVFRVTLNDLEEYAKIIFIENHSSLPGIISMKAYEILKEAKEKDRGYLAGRHKKSIIASVLYMSQFYFYEDLRKHATQKTVAGALKITEPTIRTIHAKLLKIVDEPHKIYFVQPILTRKREKRKYPPKKWYDPSYQIDPLARESNPLEVLKYGVLMFIASIVYGNLDRVFDAHNELYSMEPLKPQKKEIGFCYGWRGQALLSLGLVIKALEKDIEHIEWDEYE